MPDARGSSSGHAASSQPEAALGVEIGSIIANKYRVERVIGKGGMGVVVAASQLALERMVAIKLIRADCAQNPVAVERMLREAKAAAVIKNEHVAQVLDVGTLDTGRPFIVMEYLEGNDLQSLLQRDGPLPVADAVDFVLQACEAIAEAHRNGIVHRDIKPANLFIARLPGGMTRIKVVDFGISKTIGIERGQALTQPCTVVGSRHHMAPEQMRGAVVDARTDVWAIGVVLYEMISGRKPFPDQGWLAMCAQMLNDAVPLLVAPLAGASHELHAVVEKCLRRLPEDRFANVAELAVALSRFGTRKAHVSLERIVGLATSTGSLSARTLDAAASVDIPEGLRRRPSENRAAPGAGSGTPWPVSTIARSLSGSRSGPLLALGVAATLCGLVPVALWFNRSPRAASSPAEVSTGSATLRPLPTTTVPGARDAALEAPSEVGDLALSTRPAPDLRRSPAPGARVEPVTEASHRAPAVPPAILPTPPRARQREAVPSDPGAAAAAPAPAPRAGPPHEHALKSDGQGESPATPDVADPPSSPAKGTPANPWDLGDIEF